MRVQSKSAPIACAALACALAGLLAGCVSMAPDYQAPPSPVPPAWPASAQADTATGLAPPVEWQDYFTDPLLRQLIRTALDNNRDLRVAALRVEEARAAFRIQRADQFPTIGGNAQAARARVPGDLNGSGQSAVGSEYRAEVGLNAWELDLWGRVRNLRQAALERWLATEEGRRSVEVALVAQVANGYIGLREIDERLARASRSVATRVESERIYTRRYEVGSSSKLELTQVQTLLAQAQVLQAQLEQARAVQLHAFGQLLGADPGPLPPVIPFNEAAVLADISPGLPSDLLLARPDILAAEHQLRAANADIGAARAAFFPQISLTGSYGSASAEFDGLFDAGSRAWTFVPLLHVPIFNGGRLRANLDLGEVRSDIAVARYEQSIQTAFREVADALATRHWAAERLDVQRRALEAISERARLAQLRYSAGSASFIEVLDAQRDLLDAEQLVVQFQRELLSSQVALYAALGGGTPVAATEDTAAAPPGDNEEAAP